MASKVKGQVAEIIDSFQSSYKQTPLKIKVRPEYEEENTRLSLFSFPVTSQLRLTHLPLLIPLDRSSMRSSCISF